MHEISIICSAMDEIEYQCSINNINKVSKVLLAIGEFAAIDYSALRFAFESVAKDTICDGAVLDIMEIPAVDYCEACHKEYKVSFVQRSCPLCGVINNMLSTGDEILLYKIEGE